MKLEEYLKSLPPEIMSGQDVRLPDRSIRDIFEFLELGGGDVFYHLGCGDGGAVSVAAREFGVKKAAGIDSDAQKIARAKDACGDLDCAEFTCGDVAEADMDDATAVLFWFADADVIRRMVPKLRRLQRGCRIATLWGPLPGYMPHRVRFPYVVSEIPLRPAKSLQDQLLAVFGVKCVDFVTAWEHAERYTRAIELPDAENNRFVTIVQSLVIWINAKNLGVACGDGVPDPIRAYMGILRNFYDIELDHMLDK